MLLALLCFCLEVAAVPQPYISLEGLNFGETQDGGEGGIRESRIFFNRLSMLSAEHNMIEIPWHWELNHCTPG